jgi:hypothetical protein
LLRDRLRDAAKSSFGVTHPAWPYFELSRRLLDSAGALSEYPDRVVGALLLLREAGLSAMRARVLRSDPKAFGSVEQASEAALWDRFAAAPLGVELLSNLGQAEQALARDALLNARPGELARLGRKGQIERKRALGRLVAGLVQQLEREATALAWVRTVRRLRFAAVGSLLVALGFMAVQWAGAHVSAGERNLARDKPVTASSYYRDEPYSPTRLVDGNRRTVGFHTEWQDNPTVTIDLLDLGTVRRVVVYNRNEYRERAVPLIIETSSDGKTYQQFARRDDTFAEWEAKAGPVRARYVRLRVPNHTCFHLNEVEVY